MGCYDTKYCISWYAAHSAAEVVAAKVAAAGVLLKGCWIFSAAILRILALSKEVILGLTGLIRVL